MSKKLFLVLFVLISFSGMAQSQFQKGYYINESGAKKEVLIKNEDWRQNPEAFKYKISENGDVKIGDISTVREFQIYGNPVYKKFSGEIDQSSENRQNLSRQSEPEFTESTVFLKVLIDGEADLYQYVGDYNRFFYNLEGGKLKQLVYKEFTDNNIIRENNGFRTELKKQLTCKEINESEIRKVNYTVPSLTSYFEKYNECVGSHYVSYLDESKEGFSLKLKAGFSSFSMDIERFASVATTGGKIDMNTEISPRIGFEAEYILPFNNNRWAIFVEPTFESMKAEGNHNYVSYNPDRITNISIDYKTINIPLGLRYYGYLNNNSSIFLNVAIKFQKFFDGNVSDTEEVYSEEMNIRSSSAYAAEFGLGYAFKRKLGLEFRYSLPKDVFAEDSDSTSSVGRWEAKTSSISLLLSYTIF